MGVLGPLSSPHYNVMYATNIYMANNIHLPSLDIIVLKLLMKLTSVRYQIDNPSSGNRLLTI